MTPLRPKLTALVYVLALCGLVVAATPKRHKRPKPFSASPACTATATGQGIALVGSEVVSSFNVTCSSGNSTQCGYGLQWSGYQWDEMTSEWVQIANRCWARTLLCASGITETITVDIAGMPPGKYEIWTWIRPSSDCSGWSLATQWIEVDL